MRNWLLLIAVLPVLGCEGSIVGPAEAIPTATAGITTLKAALENPGRCLGTGFGNGWYTSFDDSANGVGISSGADWTFVRVTLWDSSEMVSGFVDFEDREIHWFDLREHRNEGRAPTLAELVDLPDGAILIRNDNGPTLLYPAPSARQRRAEWITTRGQLLIQLVNQAIAACSTAS